MRSATTAPWFVVKLPAWNSIVSPLMTTSLVFPTTFTPSRTSPSAWRVMVGSVSDCFVSWMGVVWVLYPTKETRRV